VQPLYYDKNLQLAFGVTLMVILGVSSTMPVLPTIMRELDVPAESIGLVITAFTLPGVFLAPFAGILADRVGRKRILVASLLVFGIFGAACSLADSFHTLLVLRLLQGVGVSSIGVVNMTVIGDLYDGRDRTTAIGYTAIALSFGTATFPVVGGLLAELGWRYPFALPIMAVPLALIVYMHLDNPEPTSRDSFSDYVKGTAAVIRKKRALAIFAITLLTHIILYGPFNTYFPVLLRDRFEVSPAAIGLLVSVSSFATALASSQLGRLTTPRGERIVFRVSFILFGLSMVLIPLMPHFYVLILPVALFGTAMGLGIPIRVSMLSELAPMSNRASVMSVNGMILRLGQSVAPVLMGWVLVALGMDAVYFVAGGITVVMLGIAMWLVE
jgi:MFS family permease